MFNNPLWIDKLKQILIGRQSRWAVMECKTYAVHARNTRAVGTSAKKHIPEPKTNTGARSVEWRPPLILCHTPSWTRRDCREIEADSSSCPFPEISYLDALSLMMAPSWTGRWRQLKNGFHLQEWRKRPGITTGEAPWIKSTCVFWTPWGWDLQSRLCPLTGEDMVGECPSSRVFCWRRELSRSVSYKGGILELCVRLGGTSHVCSHSPHALHYLKVERIPDIWGWCLDKRRKSVCASFKLE